jgi:hypothetical protein
MPDVIATASTGKARVYVVDNAAGGLKEDGAGWLYIEMRHIITSAVRPRTRRARPSP